ncbi:S-adenosyl-L-methionine-dependent methyltransferase [Auriculariales sp. MPI-PUGE-AT-0066]|nr:S-adenosyl-L-methionine-dependent methyltransferase [Auriculariales sp. MPI-PUGE-AT-0066]
MTSPSHPLRALEFYAGIGGLQLAALRSTAAVEVVAAYDWDQSAVRVYAHNYGHTHPIHRADISRMTASDLAGHNASVWLLSPPCHADPRASSFHHLFFAILPELLPDYIFLENVAGFQGSLTQLQALDLLREHEYTVQEYLLSPLQFGIPNSRRRYYLLARRRSQFSSRIPEEFGEWLDPRNATSPEGVEASSARVVAPLSDFLDENDDPEVAACAVPDKVLHKWAHEFDIVLPSSTRTCCFTRGYTHLAQGSGSVLQQNSSLDTSSTFREFRAAVPSRGPGAVDILHPLNLRYLTPNELLRLMYFLPQRRTKQISEHKVNIEQQSPHLSTLFNWPSDISRKTRYKLLGNSINVHVVTQLLNYLFSEPFGEEAVR